MFQMQGRYNEAVVYTDNIDAGTTAQITNLLNQDYLSGCKIRFMPDVHASAGCTAGTALTMREGDEISPFLLGADIGCGVLCVRIKEKEADLELLDQAVRVATTPRGDDKYPSIDGLRSLQCWHIVKQFKHRELTGDPGGGNHFVELDRDEDGNLYLLIHSGSGLVGETVARYHQLTAKGRAIWSIPTLEGDYLGDYLHDVGIVCRFASLYCKAMACEILNTAGLLADRIIDCPHNYIDLEQGMLRRGAIDASLGKQVVIPISMRDGSLLCTGRGNPDWNCSAPCGAGWVLNGGEAEEPASLDAHRKATQKLYALSVPEPTLDETHYSYRSMQEITGAVADTVQVDRILRPIYNSRSGADERGRSNGNT